MSAPDRRKKLDRAHPVLSIRRQCVLLSVARSGVYRPPPANDDADLALMRRIDKLFMTWPFLGSRRLAEMLRAEGCRVNRKRVQRLMRLMGIAALGPTPRTSKPAPGHKVYPYLLRGLAIERPNQVWCADITYIPIGRGFLYLVAIMDRRNRIVPARRGHSGARYHTTKTRTGPRKRRLHLPRKFFCSSWHRKAGPCDQLGSRRWTGLRGEFSDQSERRVV